MENNNDEGYGEECFLGIELDEYAIFRRALMIPAAKQRSKFLDQICGDERVLRDRVAKLLKADGSDWGTFDGFLSDQSLSTPDCDGAPSIENYHFLEKIGAGGMADVFAAEQLLPFYREVAVKVQRTNKFQLESVRRFELEQQTLAKLTHENIATIYDAGHTREGYPYVSMELVKGEPITQFCNDHCLNITERLHLMQGVLNGIEHAHHHGVIHRDLKPANILVTETLRGAQVKIIDFGIAKDTEAFDAEQRTRDSQILGTLDYMSPEQIRSVVEVDAYTDVFSLGVILHEMLVDEIPLAREIDRTTCLEERLRCLCETVPAPISSTFRELKGSTEFAKSRKTSVDDLMVQFTPALDQMVSRMLAKRAEDRYGTVQQLSVDMQRVLDGEGLKSQATQGLLTTSSNRRFYPSFVFVLVVFVLLVGVGKLMTSGSRVVIESDGPNGTGMIISRGSEEVRSPVDVDSDGRLDSTGRGEPESENAGFLERSKEEFYYLVIDMRPVAASVLAEAWPAESQLDQLWNELMVDVGISGIPDHAAVEICDWNNEPFKWHQVNRKGDSVTLPLGEVSIQTRQTVVAPSLRMRITCSGYETKEFVISADELDAIEGDIKLMKDAEGVPDGMRLVIGATDTIELRTKDGLKAWFKENGFWIDVHEVSNQDYQEFIEADGYQSPEFWSSAPFLMDGEVLSFGSAMKRFVDQTGNPGPASWIGGRFPEGMELYPVSGISFFEAAAYCRFRGKRLPTIVEWRKAISSCTKWALVARSNFASDGPEICGANSGVSRFNIRDLGGNVREWCSSVNQNGSGFILGGSWENTRQVIHQNVAVDRWDRAIVNGFRCCKDRSETAKTQADRRQADTYMSTPIKRRTQIPATLAELNALHKYDRSKLTEPRGNQIQNARLAERRVTYAIAQLNAPYDQKHFLLHLFAPAEVRKRLPCVVVLSDLQWFSDLTTGSSPAMMIKTESLVDIAALVSQGGVVLCIPEFSNKTPRRLEGNGEKALGIPGNGNKKELPPHSIIRAKHVMRSLDYLASRTDLDSNQFFLLGIGDHGADAVRLLALDDRFQAGSLIATGYKKQSRLGLRLDATKQKVPDVYHYAPHARQPLLMINGAYDLEYPELTCQKPLFNELGSAVKEKIKIGSDLLNDHQQLNAALLHAIKWFRTVQ